MTEPPVRQLLPTPYVPLPCALIDLVMPTLKDTEWRVLLVVLRQTLPRRPHAEGRRWDWLTHDQLKRRTGRASEAVSAAVDVLVRRGLIVVRSERGVLLFYPAERRRNRGRLYYAPGPALALSPSAPSPAAGKPKTTEESSPTSSCRFRIVDPAEAANLSPGQRDRIEAQKAKIRKRLGLPAPV
jgi:hypothetical protein